jgi:hypothetical protein
VGPLLSSGNGGERAGKLAQRDEPPAVEPVEGSP